MTPDDHSPEPQLKYREQLVHDISNDVRRLFERDRIRAERAAKKPKRRGIMVCTACGSVRFSESECRCPKP